MAEPTEERLLALLKRFQGQLPADDYESTRDLAAHREWGVALENLCEQLFEHSIAVDPEALREVAELSAAMGLPESTWAHLKEHDGD